MEKRNTCDNDNSVLVDTIANLHELAHKLDRVMWIHTVRGARGARGRYGYDEVDYIQELLTDAKEIQDIMQEAIDRISGAEYERNKEGWQH